MKIVKFPKLNDELESISFNATKNKHYVNFYLDGVQAGFPSPAEDFKEHQLSLDERYLNNPDATFIIKVVGNSMYPTLQVDDILIVRSDFELTDNKIGIISVNNTDFTVKRFDKNNRILIADNPDFENIKIALEDTLLCLGVVQQIIREL
ncbi:MAG TPA: DNA repair protein [Flavobacteriia bacterium]|nr:DNA repair protein [Flavobacteriia bacterium]